MILLGNEVVSAISKNISQAISRGMISSTDEISKLYKDTPIQGAQKPYAFIHSVNTTHTPEIKEYAMQGFIIDVRCHPKDAQTNVQSWARQLSTKLIDCVDKIYVHNQQVRVGDIEINVTDNVLHVICNYTFRVLKQTDPGINMETLSYAEHTRNR